jgi:hypothetical protein
VSSRGQPQADNLEEGRARMEVAMSQLKAAKQHVEQEKERVRYI